jgi:hypothetical protein
MAGQLTRRCSYGRSYVVPLTGQVTSFSRVSDFVSSSEVTAVDDDPWNEARYGEPWKAMFEAQRARHAEDMRDFNARAFARTPIPQPVEPQAKHEDAWNEDAYGKVWQPMFVAQSTEHLAKVKALLEEAGISQKTPDSAAHQPAAGRRVSTFVATVCDQKGKPAQKEYRAHSSAQVAKAVLTDIESYANLHLVSIMRK